MEVILHGTKRIYAVTVTTAPTLINDTKTRLGLVIRNTDADDVFLGKAAVTISDGFPLKENEILVDEDAYDRESGNVDGWYGVVASRTASLRVIEYS